jgi:hydroxyquinol 1,2-dioxygenase
VTAPGHRPLTTHIFVAGSEYIESDTVFAVKKSLVVDFTEVTDPKAAAKWHVDRVPFRHADFEIVMQPGS